MFQGQREHDLKWVCAQQVLQVELIQHMGESLFAHSNTNCSCNKAASKKIHLIACKQITRSKQTTHDESPRPCGNYS